MRPFFMLRLFLIWVLFASACIDNPLTQTPIVIEQTDAGSDAQFSEDLPLFTDLGPDFDVESCYFPEEQTDDMCNDPFIVVQLPRGDRCSSPCEHQVDCPAGCICFARACVTGADLR